MNALPIDSIRAKPRVAQRKWAVGRAYVTVVKAELKIRYGKFLLLPLAICAPDAAGTLESAICVCYSFSVELCPAGTHEGRVPTRGTPTEWGARGLVVGAIPCGCPLWLPAADEMRLGRFLLQFTCLFTKCFLQKEIYEIFWIVAL